MNGKFQMQGCKNWIFPKEMNANRFFLLGLSLAGNLVKPLLSLYGSVAMALGYWLWSRQADSFFFTQLSH
jgi:hypothetical protein